MAVQDARQLILHVLYCVGALKDTHPRNILEAFIARLHYEHKLLITQLAHILRLSQINKSCALT